jgi:hypothetical protein
MKKAENDEVSYGFCQFSLPVYGAAVSRCSGEVLSGTFMGRNEKAYSGIQWIIIL